MITYRNNTYADTKFVLNILQYLLLILLQN